MGLCDSVMEMHHCMGIASLVLREPELQDNEVQCRNVCLWIWVLIPQHRSAHPFIYMSPQEPNHLQFSNSA